jgi:hypothetical protein
MAALIQAWFNQQVFGGLPLWLDKYRLDSVILHLNEA